MKGNILIEKIKGITLSGWQISFLENYLGVPASGERVLNIFIKKEGREIGTGMNYDSISDEILYESLCNLFNRVNLK